MCPARISFIQRTRHSSTRVISRALLTWPSMSWSDQRTSAEYSNVATLASGNSSELTLNDRSTVNQLAGGNGNLTRRAGDSPPAADDLLVDRTDDLVEVADDRVVGALDHGGLLVGVDRHEGLRGLDAGHVLDRTGDPAGDVDVRGDPTAGLADLLGVRAPAESRDHAGDAQGPVEVVDEFEDLAEAVLRAHSAAGPDHGSGRGQPRGVIG